MKFLVKVECKYTKDWYVDAETEEEAEKIARDRLESESP